MFLALDTIKIVCSLCQGKVFCVGDTDSEKAGVGNTYVRYDKGCRKYRHPFSIGGMIKRMICKVRPLAGRK